MATTAGHAPATQGGEEHGGGNDGTGEGAAPDLIHPADPGKTTAPEQPLVIERALEPCIHRRTTRPVGRRPQ
jgi:hypothetical protein